MKDGGSVEDVRGTEEPKRTCVSEPFEHEEENRERGRHQGMDHHKRAEVQPADSMGIAQSSHVSSRAHYPSRARLKPLAPRPVSTLTDSTNYVCLEPVASHHPSLLCLTLYFKLFFFEFP